MLKTILTGAQYLSAVNGEADPRITHVVVSGFLKTFFHKSMRKVSNPVSCVGIRAYHLSFTSRMP